MKGSNGFALLPLFLLALTCLARCMHVNAAVGSATPSSDLKRPANEDQTPYDSAVEGESSEGSESAVDSTSSYEENPHAAPVEDTAPVEEAAPVEETAPVEEAAQPADTLPDGQTKDEKDEPVAPADTQNQTAGDSPETNFEGASLQEATVENPPASFKSATKFGKSDT
eukprot:GHVT01049009.1.p2 GENE.GHVT01049009.1~~GHVT01049009.1.p2  ORF type:complete len:169 (+),score=44.11 GHVT01049009.1:5034-5540(+)